MERESFRNWEKVLERQFKDSSDRYVRMRHPSVDAHPSAAEEKQKRGTTGSPRDDPREDVQEKKADLRNHP